jgi:hypothetical protein
MDLYFTGGYVSDKTVIHVPFPNGGYLSKSSYLDPYQYYTPNLLGGSVEFDVDLSSSVCGCVAAFYLVKMPGHKDNGSLEPAQQGKYYCDANKVEGNYCPEFDIMESNQWALQSTTHSCDAPNSNGHYYKCNRGGTCAHNVKDLSYHEYGPGGDFKINTLKWMHVKMTFDTHGSDFGSYTNTIS